MSERVKRKTDEERLDVEGDAIGEEDNRKVGAEAIPWLKEHSSWLSPKQAAASSDPTHPRAPLNPSRVLREDMKLAPYLRVLWRWKWIIVATLVTTVAVAMIGTLRAEPVYTVTATLRMRTTSGGSVDWVSYDINYAERLMNTYAIIATSGPMLNQLEVDLEGDLPDHVEAEVVPETELMRIRVDDTDPALASDAANRLAAMLVTLSKGEGTGERKPVVDVLKERLDELDAELKQARDEYRELVGQNPGDPERLTVVSQSIELKEEIYTSLLRQYEDARIREAIQVNSLSLVDPATPPSSPARPRMVINLGLGILGGLGAGLGLAVILEKFTVVSEAGDPEDIYRD